MSARVSILCLGAVLASAGCLPDASGSTDLDEASVAPADRYAVVELSATHPRASSEPALATAVQAHFVEARGIDRASVVRALDVWTPTDATGCVIEQGPASVASLDAEVTLLDAGTLGVSGNGGATRLSPRSVPAYIPQFRGVVYGAEATRAPVYAHDEPYIVWADGHEVEPFAVGLRAPAAVEWVDVNGAEPGSATALPYDPAAGVDVSFVSDAEDVFVSVRSLSAIGEPRIECRLTATQRLTIDGGDVTAVFGGDARLEVVARTATTVPLPPESGQDGIAVYSFVDRIELVPAR